MLIKINEKLGNASVRDFIHTLGDSLYKANMELIDGAKVDATLKALQKKGIEIIF